MQGAASRRTRTGGRTIQQGRPRKTRQASVSNIAEARGRPRKRQSASVNEGDGLPYADKPTAKGARNARGANTINFALRISAELKSALEAEAKSTDANAASVLRAAAEWFFEHVDDTTRDAFIRGRATGRPTKLIIRKSKNRVTRTSVQVEDGAHEDCAWKPSEEDEGRRYATVCTTHGSAKFWEDRKEAESELAQPWRWCQGCYDGLMKKAPPPSAR